MSVERASESPVHTMLSGPAGGVSGAAFVAGLAGHPEALGFDIEILRRLGGLCAASVDDADREQNQRTPGDQSHRYLRGVSPASHPPQNQAESIPSNRIRLPPRIARFSASLNDGESAIKSMVSGHAKGMSEP